MSRVRFSFILACSLLAAQHAAASSPAIQIRDIDGGISDRGRISLPFHAMAGSIFFTASDSLNGKELWRTDGTESGTELIRDLCPGPCSALDGPPIAWRNRLYFLAKDGRRFGLWRTDGTEAGTELVEALFANFGTGPQPVGGGIRNFLIDLGSSLLISRGQVLWHYNENAGLTQLPLLRDSLQFRNDRLAALNGFALYGDDGHLWRTEGSPESTRVVASDLSPGSMTLFGGRIFFTANSEGSQLWHTDGTEAGTVPVAPNLMLRNPKILTVAGSQLFFVASGPNGRGFWRTDGTDAGTEWIAPVDDVDEAISSGGLLYLSLDTDTYGCELWVSDGTAQGTRLVRDIRPGRFSSDPSELQPFADGIVFNVANQLWLSDGTEAGTRQVSLGDSSLSRRTLRVVDGVAYFGARSPGRGDSLWRSDGTEPAPVREIDRAASSFPSHLTALGSTVLFSAGDAPSGQEPWRSDGTSEGTRLLRDVHAGQESSFPKDFTQLGSKVVFGANLRINTRHSLELWGTDGTQTGTSRLGIFHDLPSNVFGRLESFLAVGDLLYFSASDEAGAELWRSDGTEAGTWRVSDILPGTFFLDDNFPNHPRSSFPRNLAALGDTVYFAANGGEGVELWRSDGSEAGTRLVRDLRSGPESAWPTELTAFGNWLYFTAVSDDGQVREVWRTQGTEASTSIISDVPADSPRLLTVSGGNLYLIVGGRERSHELWQISPSAAPSRVSSLDLNGPAIGVTELRDVNGRLFFEASHASTGSELWTSDGTPAGTRLVKDLEPGPESSNPTAFEAVDGVLLFAAATSASGREMWVSDGTAARTQPLPEIAPGVVSSSPADFTSAGSRIFFSAGDPERGRELWALEREAVLDALDGGTPPALFLESQRFEVTAEWNTGTEQGFGQPVSLTDDSGYFWFFGEDNVELVVKVLDACEAFDRFWVFAAGLTDVEVTLTVRDRLTGEERQYSNPQGRAFLPIQDTNAFATCSS